MKNNRIALLLGYLMITSHAMEVPQKKLPLKPITQAQTARQTPYKTEMVWIKTSDGLVIEMPLWYIDQMKVLQLLFLQQKGQNNKDNPLDATMVTSDQLTLLQMALKNAFNPAKLELFCDNLKPEEKTNLINTVFTLEAQGLAALLMNSMFSPEIQERLGASYITRKGVIAPVVTYLQTIEMEKTVLEGHTDWIDCVAYSPDGNYMLSGAWDGNLILWNGKTGDKIKVVKANGNGGMTCIAYSPDSNYIVSANNDLLTLWNGKTGEQIKVIDENNGIINCVAYSPDGNYIVSGSRNGNLVLRDSKTGEQIKILHGHNDWVNCVAYSPDGNYIVSGSRDHNLILWDSKTGEQIKILHGHRNSVSCVAYSPDGNYIVSGASFDNLILWNGKTGDQIKAMHKHKSSICCVAYSPDGNCIASGARDRKLTLWDGKTGQLIKAFEANGIVSCVAYSPSGNYIVTGILNNLILWKLINPQILNFIATKLDIAQARLLYRLYLGKINNVPVVLDKKDPDYQIYVTLPQTIQQFIKTFLPFEESSIFIKDY